MHPQVLLDKKWIKFLRRIRLFRYAPFAVFVLAAGSMATGNVRPESDFDVIVGTRSGRIFTARFFCVALFGIFGWRRKKRFADKVCFNHFVTEKSYRLSPPHNQYWQELYINLVPVYGDSAALNNFWNANQDWIGKGYRSAVDDLRYIYRKPSLLKKAAEWVLRSFIGDFLELFLKRVQMLKIKQSLKNDAVVYQPRLVYSDVELEFHPHTKRIEEFCQFKTLR